MRRGHGVPCLYFVHNLFIFVHVNKPSLLEEYDTEIYRSFISTAFLNSLSKIFGFAHSIKLWNEDHAITHGIRNKSWQVYKYDNNWDLLVSI